MLFLELRGLPGEFLCLSVMKESTEHQGKQRENMLSSVFVCNAFGYKKETTSSGNFLSELDEKKKKRNFQATVAWTEICVQSHGKQSISLLHCYSYALY